MCQTLCEYIVSLTCTISGAFPAAASTVTCLCDTNQWGNEQVHNRNRPYCVLGMTSYGSVVSSPTFP